MSNDKSQTQSTDERLTDAQKRARDWLPSDGSWRTDPGRLVAALNSLSRAWPGCVHMEWAHCGPRSGLKQRWRFSARGVEMREIVNNPQNPPNSSQS